MNTQNHIYAVVTSMDDSESTLRLAKDAVDQGGHATVLMNFSNADRTHIRDYALSEDLSLGEAEAQYIDSSISHIRDYVGAGTNAVLTRGISDGPAVIESAVRSQATAVAVPSGLAGRRSWRKAMARTPVQVIVVPAQAA